MSATRWDFDGRVAIVTGGSRGIGLAVAEALTRGGANVVITGRKADALEAAAAALGADALAVRGSADAEGHAADVVGQAKARFGRVDFLVNNAGTNPQYGPLQEADLSAVDKVWAVNLRAPLVFAQEVWRSGFGPRGGAIVNMSSVGAIRVGANLGAYHVSKAGLQHMTRQLAYEMAPRVRVNAVAPAVVRTGFSRALFEADDPVAAYPLGRLGEADDVAEAVAFLLSDSSSWITGQTLVLDGGHTLAHR